MSDNDIDINRSINNISTTAAGVHEMTWEYCNDYKYSDYRYRKYCKLSERYNVVMKCKYTDTVQVTLVL